MSHILCIQELCAEILIVWNNFADYNAQIMCNLYAVICPLDFEKSDFIITAFEQCTANSFTFKFQLQTSEYNSLQARCWYLILRELPTKIDMKSLKVIWKKGIMQRKTSYVQNTKLCTRHPIVHKIMCMHNQFQDAVDSENFM